MRLAFRVGDVGPRPYVTKSRDKSCLVEKGSGGVLPLLVHVSTHETCVFNGYHFAVSVWGCGTPAGAPAAQAHVMATAISPDRRCECRCCSLLTDKRAATMKSFLSELHFRRFCFSPAQITACQCRRYSFSSKSFAFCLLRRAAILRHVYLWICH